MSLKSKMAHEADRWKLHKNKAAENIATLCSLLATYKAQEINSREWLNDIIAKLPYYLEKDSGKVFVNFFLMFGSWRSLIRIQLEFKYLCWRNKEGVSKLTFACYLFLFRHGLHGKHRFSLFFFPWNPRNPCLKEIIKCILTHSLFYLWKRQCVLYRMLTIKEQKNGKGRCFG